MKKKNIYIVLLSIACIIASCGRQAKIEDGILCKCLLIRLGSPDENYLIEVTNDSIIRVSSGMLGLDFYREVLYEDYKLKGKLSDFKFFKEVRMQKEEKLQPEEIDTLKACISDIEDIKWVNPFIQSNWHDAWAAIIIVGEKKFVFVDIPYDEFRIFLKTIMSFSPVELKKEDGQNKVFENAIKREKQPYKKDTWNKIKSWFY